MEELNEIQKIAAENLLDNISLSAGAGTGKTKVLTRRYINILKNAKLTKGREIDEILAITFTNKATEEMKAKIKNALLAEDNKDLREIGKYFSRSQIFTIHGFCSQLIRRRAISIGVSPDFEICEPEIAKAMISKVMDQVLDEYKNDQEVYDYLRETGEYSLRGLKKELINLYDVIRNKSMTIEMVSELNDSFNGTLSFKGFEDLINLLHEYAALNPGPTFKKFYVSEEFILFLNNPYYDYLGTIENNLGKSQSEKVVEKREEILKEIIYLKDNLEIHNLKYYKLILNILKRADQVYSSLKNERELLDYNDLEDYCLKILSLGVKTDYKYILVDEFQDTNPTQIEILKRLTNNLSKDTNLFVVGDPKQSIYGFRGGSLKSYKEFTKDMKYLGALDLQMKENYRSSAKLVESYNFIFSKLLKEDYNPINANVKGNEKIKILHYNSDEELAVASYIKDLIDGGAKMKDIAVIFRRKKDIDKLENALIERGIRVNNTSKKFSDLKEVRDLLVLKAAASNKKDIINILSYLKSPMVGLDENSIFLLALKFKENGDISYNDKDELEEDMKQLYVEGLERLNKLREIINYYSLSDFYIKAIELLSYYEIARLCYGKNAPINIDKFLRLVRDFEKKDIRFDLDFKDYLEAGEVEEEFAEDGVNLMTIHKSKGLEFNHVIICDFNLRTPISADTNKFQVGEIGLGINLEGRDAKYKIIRESTTKEEIEEEKRIFYVAATRAKETLTFSIFIEDKDKPEPKLKKNSYAMMLKSTGFSDLDYIFKESVESGRAKLILIPDLDDIKKDDWECLEDESSYLLDKIFSKKRILKYYSATSFLLYLKDPDLFIKRYLLGDEDELSYEDGMDSKAFIIDPRTRGLIVHKYAELEPYDTDEFLNKMLKVYDLSKTEELVKVLKDHINAYNKIKKGSLLYSEFNFHYKFEDIIITGSIDQIREVDGKIELIDIKTGSLNEDPIKYYSHQLHIYIRAFEAIKGVKVDRAKLLSTADKKEYDIDIGEDKINATMEKFKDFVIDVEKNLININ
ncbi:UvrD-helicase domain-containing protein [Peptoniphilus catoniae]|uniref:UvrD-helicase domain-containing protein n=1 Tax=Peptoniphilus catoniae TaxID=1660341 RepID=UPI0010FED49E|nr:UvrD-helicase domain-containing protein [Peptoniphilus catoniae]